MKKDKIFAHIEADQVAQLCQDLVRYPTINPPGDELALVRFVLEYLQILGFEGELVPHSENRASAIARLRGSGGLPALMFNGHADVVPVGNQPWRYDPFSGEIAEGKVWGRGSCDMKGGIAAMLAAARSIALTQQKLRGDLLFSVTAGEEVNVRAVVIPPVLSAETNDVRMLRHEVMAAIRSHARDGILARAGPSGHAVFMSFLGKGVGRHGNGGEKISRQTPGPDSTRKNQHAPGNRKDVMPYQAMSRTEDGGGYRGWGNDAWLASQRRRSS